MSELKTRTLSVSESESKPRTDQRSGSIAKFCEEQRATRVVFSSLEGGVLNLRVLSSGRRGTTLGVRSEQSLNAVSGLLCPFFSQFENSIYDVHCLADLLVRVDLVGNYSDARCRVDGSIEAEESVKRDRGTATKAE
jgi:hypothetical protein